MAKPGKSSVSEKSAESSAVNDNATGGSDQTMGTGAFNAGVVPQTCCSNCKTVFEVSVELLSSTDTRVRCGECLSIFDALANLRDDDEPLGEPRDVDSGDARANAGSAAKTADHSSASLPSAAEASAAALAGLSNDSSSLDVTYSDFDLFSAEAGLPEVAYFDETRDAGSFDFDELAEVEMDETFSDTLFAEDVTVDARSAIDDAGKATDSFDLDNIALDSDIDIVTDEGPKEPLIFNYNERDVRAAGGRLLPPESAAEKSSKSNSAESTVGASIEGASAASTENVSVGGTNLPTGSIDHQVSAADRVMHEHGIHTEKPAIGGSWWLRTTLSFLVVLLAAGLYGYREWATLQHHKHIRPTLEVVCSVFSCSLSDPVDLGAMKVLKRTVFSHPTLDNALIINLEFVNEASFSQRYPTLEIRLTDRNGALVVKNDFEPVDYLDSWQSGDVMDINKRLSISLNVEDPGHTAMSFELDFR